ncbi:MAG: choice-of-anchor E domain-containing protein [Planctomycetota bacterium]
MQYHFLSIVITLAMFSGHVVAEEIVINRSAATSTAYGISATLDFPQFDPNEGILTAVEFSLSVDAVSTIYGRSNALGLYTSITAHDIYTYRHAQLGGQVLFDDTVSQPNVWVGWTWVDAYSQDATLDVVSDPGISSYASSSSLGGFIGGGSVPIEVSAGVAYNLTLGGNVEIIDSLGSRHAIVDGTLTYTYDIPEPATFSLLILGGLPAVRRRWR